MKARMCKFIVCVCILYLFSALVSSSPAFSQNFSPNYQPLPAEALGNLVAPIALYPDPLLAQVLQASMHQDQIAQASAWIQQNRDKSQLNNQPWDPSVIAIAHYPSVLGMMNQSHTWVMQLGLAYSNQQKAVMDSVQAMRAKAQNNGNLTNTAQQTITTQGNSIVILPASPDVIYVPVYDTGVVYTQPAASAVAPLIAFGAGMALGSWMSSDCDWDNNVVVYNGWNGGWGHYYYDHPRNGGAYAAHGETVHTANGGTFHSYSAAGVDPGVGAGTSRGWGYENGDNAAGKFSKTVVTDDGVYNVHGGGATNGDDGKGRITVSGANKDGDYGSKTWTDNDGNRSSESRSGNVFSGSDNGRWSEAASSRGFESRASGFESRASGFESRASGFESRASSLRDEGFRSGGGGFRGGFHGGGFRR